MAEDLLPGAAPKKVVVAGWIVGLPGSPGKPYSGSVFPLKTFGIEPNIASAYDGLGEHILLLDRLRRNQLAFEDPQVSFETEMLLTSIPIRVVGLAEALANYHSGGEALLKSLQNGISSTQNSLSREKKAEWTSRTQNLVDQRNAICHPYTRGSSEVSIAEVIPAVSLDYVLALGELGTYIMAGYLAKVLNETSPERANSWLGAVFRSLERTRDNYSY
jgi:hypothetical protein